MSLPTERLLVACAVAAVVFMAMYFPGRYDSSDAILGGVFAFGALLVGLPAVAHVRPLPRRTWTERLRLMGLALLVGIALGIANLMTNYGLAALDARIHDTMVQQWARFIVGSAVFAAPLLEEIGFRLVLMGGIAWLLSRLTQDRRVIFFVALAISSFLFGFAHLLRPTISVLHATGVALKDSAWGAVLGWVFWRKGLPYSIACHGAANAVHGWAWPALF